MSNAISAFGTLLKIGDGATPAETFATIAEVTKIGGPKFKMDTADVTNHSSSGGWKEFVGTLLEAGEVSLSANFIPTTPTQSQSGGLLRDLKNKTLRNFKLVFPDTGATTWAFSALVTGFESDEPIDDRLTANVTLKISGQPTLAG